MSSKSFEGFQLEMSENLGFPLTRLIALATVKHYRVDYENSCIIVVLCCLSSYCTVD